MFAYSEIEMCLAQIMEVPDLEMGAFQARLRHLRNLGVPEARKPGSGKRIAYTRLHAMQMLIALQLEAIGCLPRVAAQGADFAGRHVGEVRCSTDLFIATDPVQGFALVRFANLARLIARMPSCAILNLSLLARKLDESLEHRRTY